MTVNSHQLIIDEKV